MKSNELKRKFEELKAQWKQETMHLSRMDKVIEHPAHQEIIQMGKKALPLIFQDIIQNNNCDWMATLYLIVKEIDELPHFPEEIRGKYVECHRIWLEYAVKRGYITKHQLENYRG